MKILFLSAHLPSPRSRQAGQKTSYHLARVLAEKHSVHLLSFASDCELETHAAEDHAIFHCSDVVRVTQWTRLKGVITAPHIPFAIAARNSHRFRCKLRACLCQHAGFDVAILDHTAMWQYARELSGTVLCGSAHDVIYQRWQRKAARAPFVIRPMVSFEAARMRRWESRSVRNLAVIAPHCQKDAALIDALAPGHRQCPIEPWWLRPVGIRPAIGERQKNTVAFIGAFDRSENVDAVEFAVRSILPLIRARVPEAELHIAGAGAERLGKLRDDPGVVVAGYVPDVTEFLASKQAALIPMRLGAGIKVKMLECMAAGLPVVTTPVGCEGIDAENRIEYLVADSAEELASHVVSLLTAPDWADAMGRRAADFLRRRRSFEQAVRDLERCLSAAAARGAPLPVSAMGKC